MDARRIIAALRDGNGLPEASAVWFAGGLASGEVTDAQAGAFAMAVLLKGLAAEERACRLRQIHAARQQVVEAREHLR